MKLLLQEIKNIIEDIFGKSLFSLIVMGSSLNKKSDKQDIDFVIITRNIPTGNELSKMGIELDQYCKSKTNSDKYYTWYCNDGPWLPEAKKRENYYLHFAFLDYELYCYRINRQKNLAKFMYSKCILLYGEPPLNKNKDLLVTRLDLLKSWSGLSWILSDVLTNVCIVPDIEYLRDYMGKMYNLVLKYIEFNGETDNIKKSIKNDSICSLQSRLEHLILQYIGEDIV
mgnify:CR=1 FL=1